MGKSSQRSKFIVSNDSNATEPTDAINKRAYGTNNALSVENYTSSENRLTSFTVQTSAYAASDQISTKKELTNMSRFANGTGLIDCVSVISHANVAIDIAFHVFRGDFTLASSENAALSITDDASMENHIFSFSLAKGRFYAIGSAVGTLQTNLRFECDSNSSLWIIPQALSAVTFNTTTALHLTMGFEKD